MNGRGEVRGGTRARRNKPLLYFFITSEKKRNKNSNYNDYRQKH